MVIPDTERNERNEQNLDDEGPGWKRITLLLVVAVSYLCIGAAVFQKIEGQPEIHRRHDLRKAIQKFLGNNTCVDITEMENFMSKIALDSDFALRTLRNETISTKWDFSGSFSFVITVVSTIGYGNMAPRTKEGRLALVIYALFGIPLTMVVLSYMGQLLTRLSTKVNRLKICSRKPVLNKVLNMVLIVCLGLTMLFLVPAFIFQQVEKWHYLDGLYYCFVTLSTIGFGDYVAAISENRLSDKGAGDVYRIVTFAWILFGLAYVSLIISYITNVFVKRTEQVEKFTKDALEGEIDRLQVELKKTKTTMYQKASSVKTNVKNKSWGKPQGDAINETKNKTGVQLLSVSNFRTV
ncbi:potassium channel subfamily K member 16-like [Mytilus trossulus]|uniref:potassium channel subfamily K member 16-like n=1 Tax=Mytilus trossulus TaxID=6551 RepID=UPI003006E8AA